MTDNPAPTSPPAVGARRGEGHPDIVRLDVRRGGVLGCQPSTRLDVLQLDTAAVEDRLLALRLFTPSVFVDALLAIE